MAINVLVQLAINVGPNGYKCYNPNVYINLMVPTTINVTFLMAINEMVQLAINDKYF